jgi:hypothetical protein
MIHRICYLIGGLPSQMIAMRYGYRFLFPGMLCASGAVGQLNFIGNSFEC